MTAAPIPTELPPEVPQRLRALATRWATAGPAERANYALFLVELCEALGVERPRPSESPGGETSPYHFEYPVRSTSRDGTTTTNFVDLFKEGCFALEAKASAEGASDTMLLTAAFGQVSVYARDLAERPPYIMVLDVPRTLMLWDRWSGTRRSRSYWPSWRRRWSVGRKAAWPRMSCRARRRVISTSHAGPIREDPLTLTSRDPLAWRRGERGIPWGEERWPTPSSRWPRCRASACARCTTTTRRAC